MSRIYLPKPELWCYFLCHISFVLYAVYSIYSRRKEIYLLRSFDSFAQGPFSFLPLKEAQDSEWDHFKHFVHSSSFWFLSHVLLTKLLKLTQLHRFLPLGFTFIGAGFLVSYNGLLFTLFLVLNAVPFFFIPKRWGGAKAVTILILVHLFLANCMKWESISEWMLNYYEENYTMLYQAIVVFGWSTLKCVSFVIDALDEEKDDKERDEYKFINFWGYFFYAPTLVLGPPVIYSRFKSCYLKREDDELLLSPSLFRFLKDITRVLLWALVLEFSYYFLYLITIRDTLLILSDFNLFSLFGYGYLIGQHFQVKYTVFYGFSSAFARLDGVDPPPGPICVARVHKYSDMWKHFDRGLYEFLVKYIYSRLHPRSSGVVRKHFAMSMTFLFIYVWHGYYFVIFSWMLLNLAGILLEHLLEGLLASEIYKKFIGQRISLDWHFRIEALLGTQLMILSVIANFFFLGSYEVGLLFLRRTYASGVLNYLSLATSLVFIYFTAEYLKRKRQTKTKAPQE